MFPQRGNYELITGFIKIFVKIAEEQNLIDRSSQITHYQYMEKKQCRTENIPLK